MWIKRAALLTTLCLAACGDDPSAPPAVAGMYRLVTVNGNPVPWTPPPSQGFQPAIEHGDLYLRGDGTYGLGIGGGVGFFSSGSYSVTNDGARLTGVTGSVPDTFTVAVAGDSAVIQDFIYRYVFKRMATPQTITPGVFVLASINGRGPPLVESDTVINGERFVARVHYDTLHFMDSRFYERDRFEIRVRYLAGGDSLFGGDQWTTRGAHEMISGAIVLRGYWRVPNLEPVRDTLWIVGNDLVRRRHLINGLQEDRYVRR